MKQSVTEEYGLGAGFSVRYMDCRKNFTRRGCHDLRRASQFTTNPEADSLV